MRKVVHTCDFCGVKKESVKLPFGWGKLRISIEVCDICDDCIKKVRKEK